MPKSLLFFLSIILLAVLQTSFLPSLGPAGKVNLIFIGLAFLSVINYPAAIKWAFVGGLLLDLNSVFPFGTITLILLAVAAEINFLFRNFFTNRSLYSLSALILFGFLTYNLGLAALSCAFYWLKIGNFRPAIGQNYFLDLPWQLAANLAFAGLAYFALARTKFSERFFR